MLTQHEGHVFFHIIRDDIYVHLLFFTFFIFIGVLFCYLANLLHDKMAIIASQVMKNNWNLISQLEIHITILISRSSVFSSYMIMVSDRNVFLRIFFITNMTFLSLFKILMILFCHSHWFIEMFFGHFSAPLHFF